MKVPELLFSEGVRQVHLLIGSAYFQILAADAFNQQNRKSYGATMIVPLRVFSRNQGEIAKSLADKNQSEKIREELFLNLSHEIRLMFIDAHLQYEKNYLNSDMHWDLT